MLSRKSSLGTRLLVVFVAVAGIPAALAVVGWLELRRAAHVQAEVIGTAIPAISEVRGFAEESGRIVAAAPELAAVSDEAARAGLERFLSGQAEALRSRIARYRDAGNPMPPGLGLAESEMRAGIGRLDLLVRRRIAALGQRDDHLRRGLLATAELLDVADTLVANAESGTTAVISSLYGFDGAAPDREAQARLLDKLIEVDFFRLERMFELRAHVAEVGLVLNRVGSAGSIDELAQLRAELTAHLDVIEHRIRSVHDPVHEERALAALRTIAPGRTPPGEGDLLSAAERVIELQGRIAATQAAVQSAASRLETESAALADLIRTGAERSGAGAEQAMRSTLILYGWRAALAVAVSAAVVWFYVRGRISRRLDRLSGTMTRLVGGDLGLPVQVSGGDEIGGMEAAVEVFRRQAIANRELEAERDLNLAELRSHREELRRLVDEQTEKLRGEVAAHAEARARAEAADRAKSEFLAMMSHEIRTPMNGVLGMLRSLGRDRLSPRQRRHLDAAQVSGEGLMGILNGVLDYAKADSGTLAENPAPFDPAGLCRETVLLMAPVAREKGLVLRLDRGAGVPSRVIGDGGKLRQILFNLVANAIRFTDRGEVVLGLTGQPAAGDGATELSFSVADTGRGIAPGARERIFAAFEQEDAQTARRYGGTGLGLAICARLAAIMGGRIDLASEPGRGSVFTFRAAFAAAAGDPVPAALPQTDQPLRPLNVLVVEDIEINRMVAAGFLEEMGHRFRMAGTGEQALAMLDAESFDAVLMDVNLPGLSGIETTRRLRARSGAGPVCPPVIGVSAHVHAAEIGACLEAGMAEVVPKPVSFDALAAALARVAGGPGSQADLPVPGGDVLASAAADLGEETALRLGRLFTELAGRESLALRAALDAGDGAALAEAAHRWKGAAGNFDLPALTAVLSRVERAARAAPGTGPAPALLAELWAEADRAGAAMRAALESRGQGGPVQPTGAVKT